MEKVAEMMKNLPMTRKESMEFISKMSDLEREQFLVDCANDREGELHLDDGYDCKKCKNKGLIHILKEEPPYKPGGKPTYREWSKPCSCMKIRKSIRRMKASGLEPLIERYTFDKYIAEEEWQKAVKERGMRFLEEVESLPDKWFFMGGGVGAGKTHICTAIAVGLLRKSKEVRYMLWVDEVKRLKTLANDEEGIELIEALKRAEVLYIDDLLKPVKDSNKKDLPPSAADVRLAYEIINYRYIHPELITIISSEKHIMEIEEIDSALGSRIYEKTKTTALNIAKTRERNYRMRSETVI